MLSCDESGAHHRAEHAGVKTISVTKHGLAVAHSERPEGAGGVLFGIAKFTRRLVKPAIMKHPTVYSLLIAALVILGSVNLSLARPVDFGELSLLVRARENETSIKNEVSRRKLLHALTTQQEVRLKSEGASDSLISALRNSNFLVSKDAAAAIESERARQAAASSGESAEGSMTSNVHVFNVAFGHPINLSQWGGLDYEIAFYSYRSGGEDHIQPAFVDQFATRTEVSRTIPLVSEGEAVSQDWYPRNEVRDFRFTPYDARGDLRDRRFNFSDSVAATSYAVGRATRIDWDNPVFIDGQPYTFYPVYGAGGVSLYYIGKANETSAMVAVVARGR
jgi:hypothetical protein